MTDGIEDKQKSLIFIHSVLDDYGLTPDEFRVYAHLARRSGRDQIAFPSYLSIGKACFSSEGGNIKPNSIRRRAMRIVQRLISKGMIKKTVSRTKKGEHKSNKYYLTEPDKWDPQIRGGSDSPVTRGSDSPVTRVVTGESPEGNPLKVIQLEGNPKDRIEANENDKLIFIP